MSGNKAKVLATARANLGYREQGTNRNKFSAYWRHPAEPWCADFACYCLKMGGALDVPMSAYTPTLYSYYASRGRAGHSPRSGSLVFFNWPNTRDRIDHVGVVESVRSDGSIIAIEGNISDMVGRHIRRANIAGYGHPIYGAAPPTTPTKPTLRANPYSLPKASVQYGQRGAGVKYVQWAVGFNTQDGIFGTGTLGRVMKFQRSHPACGGTDGVAGPKTLRVMSGVRR